MVVEKVPVPLDTQVAYLEERLRCREEQIQRLEDAQKKSNPKSKDFWDIVQIFSGWLTPLTLAFVGFYINSTLQKPQMELSNAKEIQGLLAKLDDPNVTKNDADAAAITMATFGTYSIGPLISVLQTGGDVRVPAAEKGLRIVGITNPEPACDRLVGVLNNRTQLFTWMTHKSVIRLLGDLNCQSSRSSLGSYGTLLQQAKTPGGLVHYQQVVRVDASAPLDIDVMIQELQTTQEKLDNAKSP